MKTGTKTNHQKKKEANKKLRSKRIKKHFNLHGDTSSSKVKVLKEKVETLKEKVKELSK